MVNETLGCHLRNTSGRPECALDASTGFLPCPTVTFIPQEGAGS